MKRNHSLQFTEPLSSAGFPCDAADMCGYDESLHGDLAVIRKVQRNGIHPHFVRSKKMLLTPTF